MLEKPSITFSEQMKVTANHIFRLDGVSLCDQPRDTVISFNTTVSSISFLKTKRLILF